VIPPLHTLHRTPANARMAGKKKRWRHGGAQRLWRNSSRKTTSLYTFWCITPSPHYPRLPRAANLTTRTFFGLPLRMPACRPFWAKNDGARRVARHRTGARAFSTVTWVANAIYLHAEFVSAGPVTFTVCVIFANKLLFDSSRVLRAPLRRFACLRVAHTPSFSSATI